MSTHKAKERVNEEILGIITAYSHKKQSHVYSQQVSLTLSQRRIDILTMQRNLNEQRRAADGTKWKWKENIIMSTCHTNHNLH